MLRRKADGMHLTVIGAHLSSGGSPQNEQARLKECGQLSLSATDYDDDGNISSAESIRRQFFCGSGPGLCEWYLQSARCTPTVLAVDTNSAPKGGESVWRTLGGMHAGTR
eukprot:8202685-Pyramimonas_sp.AAC.1